MSAAPAEFYEEHLANSAVPWQESPWRDLFEAIGPLLPSLPVIDLGCGPGRFAQYLLDVHGRDSYRGYDFAPAVIAEAASYCEAEGFTFEVADIRVWEHGPDLPEECVYVLSEVLEHLDDDRDAITRIPPGMPIVFSVPNFWSASHFRRYLQPGSVFDRFADLLEFNTWQMLSYATLGRRIHVFRATRRADVL